MPKGIPIRLYHATAAGALPPAGSLTEGELALDALSQPARLWTQVPVTRDPSGRIDLLSDGAPTLPLSVANGGTGATTEAGAVTNLGGPWWPIVSATAPTPATDRMLWYDSVNLQLFIRFNDGATSQWVQVAGGGVGSNFLPISNPAFTGNLSGPNAAFSGTVTLGGDAALPLQAVTLQQLNSAIANANHLPINNPAFTGTMTGSTYAAPGPINFWSAGANIVQVDSALGLNMPQVTTWPLRGLLIGGNLSRYGMQTNMDVPLQIWGDSPSADFGVPYHSPDSNIWIIQGDNRGLSQLVLWTVRSVNDWSGFFLRSIGANATQRRPWPGGTPIPHYARDTCNCFGNRNFTWSFSSFYGSPQIDWEGPPAMTFQSNPSLGFGVPPFADGGGVGGMLWIPFRPESDYGAWVDPAVGIGLWTYGPPNTDNACSLWFGNDNPNAAASVAADVTGVGMVKMGMWGAPWGNRATLDTNAPGGLWVQNWQASPAGGIHFTIGNRESGEIFEQIDIDEHGLHMPVTWHDDEGLALDDSGQLGIDVPPSGEVMLGAGAGLLILTAISAPQSTALFLLGNQFARLITDTSGDGWADGYPPAPQGKLLVFCRDGRFHVSNGRAEAVHLNDMMFKNGED